MKGCPMTRHRARLTFPDERALKTWLQQTDAGRRILEGVVANACLNCQRLREVDLAVEAAKAKTLVVVGNNWCQAYSEGRVKIISGDMSPEHGLIEEARIRRSLNWGYKDVFDFCRPKGQDTRGMSQEEAEWRDYRLAIIRELTGIRKQRFAAKAAKGKP